MNPLDLDRLHNVIDRMDKGEPRDVYGGFTTSYLYLMLGEVQLADPGTCFIYVTSTSQHANKIRKQFQELVWDTEHYKSEIRHPTQIHVPDTGQDFFFISIDVFLSKFSFMGTRVHRIFFDVPVGVQERHELALMDKVQTMMTTGTEFI